MNRDNLIARPYMSLSGGMVSKLEPVFIADNQAERLVNVVVETGLAVPRPTFKTLLTIAAGKRFNGICFFTFDSEDAIFLGAGGELNLVDPDTGSSRMVGSGLSASAHWWMIQAYEFVIAQDNINPGLIFDGRDLSGTARAARAHAVGRLDRVMVRADGRKEFWYRAARRQISADEITALSG